jgi:ABC-type amino acid transport system permease subunit
MSQRRPTVKGSLSFSNPAVRAWLFQIIAILAVIGIAIYLIHNTVTNLNSRGITSGFAFLDRAAGFGIVQHLIDYEQGDTYGRVFFVGLLNTLLVSALCIVFASFIGFFWGFAVFQKTGCYVSSLRFISRRSVIFPRCCKSSSGISPYCVIYLAHVRLLALWICCSSVTGALYPITSTGGRAMGVYRHDCYRTGHQHRSVPL